MHSRKVVNVSVNRVPGNKSLSNALNFQTTQTLGPTSSVYIDIYCEQLSYSVTVSQCGSFATAGQQPGCRQLN